MSVDALGVVAKRMHNGQGANKKSAAAACNFLFSSATGIPATRGHTQQSADTLSGSLFPPEPVGLITGDGSPSCVFYSNYILIFEIFPMRRKVAPQVIWTSCFPTKQFDFSQHSRDLWVPFLKASI